MYVCMHVRIKLCMCVYRTADAVIANHWAEVRHTYMYMLSMYPCSYMHRPCTYVCRIENNAGAADYPRVCMHTCRYVCVYIEQQTL